MKNRFLIVIILMAISLFGIILIQTLWIRKTIQAEEARFDKAVFNALNNTVSGLERRQIFHFIDTKIDLPIPPNVPPRRFPPSPRKRIGYKNFDPDSLKYFNKSGNSMVVYSDTTNHSKTIIRIKSTGSDSAIETIDVNFSHDTDLITQKKENIILLSGSLDTLQMQFEIEQEELRWEQDRLVREKMDEFNKSIEQWAYEYSFDEDNLIGDFISENIDSIISRSLANNGIKLQFLSQIVKEDIDTTEIIWSAKNQQLLQNQYKTELFPNDFFRKNLFLVVDFPGKTAHIYRSIIILLAGSIIFTLIVLVTFGFTLYFIQKQKKLSDIKSDFINNMTHEFKTPIATISLATDALGSPKVFGKKETTDYYLDIIKQENKRMNNQVEKVLQMSLIENHDFQLDMQIIDLHNIIENVVHVSQLTANEKKGRIVIVLKATQSRIFGDEIQLANIINNLIDNALKYNERQPEIIIETYNKEDNIFIRISDNGVGMSKDIQKHIFEKFYRKPSGNIHNVKGFGLGLSYVKAIVQEHKGAIELSSEPGNGSVFILIFNSQNITS